MLEAGAGEAECRGLSGDGGLGQGSRGQGAQQIGQRHLADMEGLVDQGGAFAQQAGTDCFRLELHLGRTLGVTRGGDVALEAFTQTQFLRLGHVQFGERRRLQRPVAGGITEGQTQVDENTALRRLDPTIALAAHTDRHFGWVATRTTHQLHTPLCQLGGLAGE